jgi:Spy/CpxP family protein refolding chaperone
MSKTFLIILALSLGLNVGLLYVNLAGDSGRVGQPDRPPHGDPMPPRDPEVLISDHLDGMTDHLGLTEEQRQSMREILRERMPQLLQLRQDLEEISGRISITYGARELDEDRFAQLVREASAARARIDSLSSVMLLAEATLLTAEQRAEYSTVAPTVHADPRRTPPPGRRPPQRNP